MTLSDTIRQMIEQAMLSAYIVSPRFDDYKINQIDVNTADFDAILRNEVTQIVEEIERNNPTPMYTGQTSRASSPNLERIGTQTARQTMSVLQNPIDSAFGEALKYLPHAVLVTLALSLVPIIFKELTKAGGPLDLRFRRILEKEYNGFLDRQTQRNTQTGARQVIVQSRSGFIAMSGAGNYNNLREIREGGANKDRLASIEMVDHARGLF